MPLYPSSAYDHYGTSALPPGGERVMPARVLGVSTESHWALARRLQEESTLREIEMGNREAELRHANDRAARMVRNSYTFHMMEY